MLGASGSGWRGWLGRLLRLVILAVVIAAVVLGAWAALTILLDRTPSRAVWQARLNFLIGLEIAYGVALVAALGLAPILIRTLLRARRRRVRRPWAARGLLLCVSILVALGLAEATAAVWLADAPRVRGRRPAPAFRAPGPPEAVRMPLGFDDPPDDPDVDLVVLGESSAEGVPYNYWISVGKIVAWQVEEAIPGRRVRLNVLAQSGETLESQHAKLAGLTRRPEAVLVYCGHNEFSSRLPWTRDAGYYLDRRPPSPWEAFVAWAERTSPLCRLIRREADKCRIALPPPPGAGRALIDVPAYTPAEYSFLLENFRDRLERIVAYAERLGAVPILISPPGNDAGFEPNRSFLPAGTPYPERAACERDFRAARRREESDPTGAAESYRALLARYPGFAEAHYRLAGLLERSGGWDQAYDHYVAARDRDGLPMRCPTPFQEAYREVASRHRCILVDGQRYFHRIGRHGLLGEDLFHDGMHPSLRGQIALAQAVVQGLQEWRAFGWPEGTPAPTIDPARVAARFGLDARTWRFVSNFGIMFYDLTAPAHYDPSRRLARKEAYAEAVRRIEAGEPAASLGRPNLGLPEPVPVVPEAAVVSGKW